MLESLLISQVLLWLIIIILSVICFALARQIGVLYERIAPAGALAMNQKLVGGDEAPSIRVKTLEGITLNIGRPEKSGGSQFPTNKSQLLFFLSPSCPVCKTLLPMLQTIKRRETSWLEIILASDGDDISAHQIFIKKKNLQDYPYVLSETLGMTYGVSKLPYAVLIDEKGMVVALGIVNTREHLESLFEAKSLGAATIQDYLHSHDENNPLSVTDDKELSYEIR